MFHLPCINQIQKYMNEQPVHFNIYEALYSKYPHHVSTSIPAIFRAIFLLKNTIKFKCITINT